MTRRLFNDSPTGLPALLLTLALIGLLSLPGCNLIYRQNVQQGNAIEQEDLDELYIGMNKRQVLFVLGTPSIKDPFHDDRWDYVQTYARRGGRMVQRTVTLRFEDDLLEQILGADDAFAADVDMGVPNYAGVLGDDDDDDDSVSVDGDDDDSTAADNAGLDQEPEADSAIAGDDSDPGADAAESQRRAKSDVEPDIEGLGERDADTRDLDDQPEED